MQNYRQAIRTFDSSVWRYLAMWGMVAFAFVGFVGVLQNLYLFRLGYELGSIGFLAASGQMMWALVALPAGIVGRRVGPKRALTASLAFLGISSGLFFAVEFLPMAWRPVWLLTWNAAVWAASALFFVNAIPYLAGLTTPDQRGYAFALQSAVVPFSAFVGSLAAGQAPGFFARLFGLTLDQPEPYRYGLWLVPLAYGLAFLVMRNARAVSLVEFGGASHTGKRGQRAVLLTFGVIVLFQSVGDGVQQTFFSLYLDRGLGLLPSEIGTVVGISLLLPIAAALASAPVMKRFGAGATLGIASTGMSAFLATLGLFPTVLAAAVGRMGFGAMNSLGGTARNVFSQEIVPLQWRTTSAAVLTAGLALGWALASAVGGALMGEIGFAGVFLLASLCALASAALTFGFVRFRRTRAGALTPAS